MHCGGRHVCSEAESGWAERAHTHETSGLGAAINAAVGLGWYADHASAAQAMVHEGTRFEPNPFQTRFKPVSIPFQSRFNPVSQFQTRFDPGLFP